MFTPALRYAQGWAGGQPRLLDTSIMPEKENHIYGPRIICTARDRRLADRIVQALLPLIEERLDHKFATVEPRIEGRL